MIIFNRFFFFIFCKNKKKTFRSRLTFRKPHTLNQKKSCSKMSAIVMKFPSTSCICPALICLSSLYIIYKALVTTTTTAALHHMNDNNNNTNILMLDEWMDEWVNERNTTHRRVLSRTATATLFYYCYYFRLLPTLFCVQNV